MKLFDIFRRKHKEETIKKVEDYDSLSVDNNEKNYKNFCYLDELIHGGNKEIILEYDIRLDSSERLTYDYGIEIKNNIIFDGNGHVIDANNISRIFDIENKEIIFKNINFENSKGTALSCSDSTIKFLNCSFKDNHGNFGGAVYACSNSSLTFIECNFKNNVANSGGAIYGNLCKLLNFQNCTFFNNIAHSEHHEQGYLSYTDDEDDLKGGYGGAIWCVNNVRLENCLFEKNHADIFGGALWSKHDFGEFPKKPVIEAFECQFFRNSSYKKGAAIYNKNYSHVKNCYFKKNQIKFDSYISRLSYGKYNINYGYDDRNTGAAICNFRKLLISGSKFEDNQADFGGAISNFNEMNIKDCIFEKNKASDNGGAIFNAKSERHTYILNIEECSFLNNIAEKYGESIFNEEGSNKIFCKNSYFKNNSSLIYHSIIYNESDLNISKSKFIGICYCNYVIYQSNKLSSFLNINNTSFESNSPLNELIYVESGFSSIKFSKFIENDTFCILYNNGITTIDKLKFNDNSSKIIINDNVLKFLNEEFYDMISNLIESSEKSTLTVKKSVENIRGFSFLESLLENKSKIFLEYDIKMDENEQDFFEGGIELDQNNLIFDGQHHIIDANNLSRIFYITGKNIILRNIIFKNGIYFKSSVSSKFDGGGAIYISHDASVSIENCEFLGNISMGSAGVIKDYGGILKLNGSLFKNNKAEYYGGVLLNLNEELTITNCCFESNYAKQNGGVFYCNEFVLSKLNNDIYSNQMKNDEVSRWDYEHFYNLYLEECVFKDNFSLHKGGVIDCNFLNLKCKNCNFEGNFIGAFNQMNNDTDYSGGTLSIGTGVCELDSCNFVGNHSKYMGGAIYFNSGKSIIKNCIFKNNYSRQGGAIYDVSEDCCLENNKFENNFVKHIEHNHVFTENQIILDKLIFDCPVSGGAIYEIKNSKKKNCTFNNNKPTDIN